MLQEVCSLAKLHGLCIKLACLLPQAKTMLRQPGALHPNFLAQCDFTRLINQSLAKFHEATLPGRMWDCLLSVHLYLKRLRHDFSRVPFMTFILRIICQGIDHSHFPTAEA